jgi:hypothetical protein
MYRRKPLHNPFPLIAIVASGIFGGLLYIALDTKTHMDKWGEKNWDDHSDCLKAVDKRFEHLHRFDEQGERISPVTQEAVKFLNDYGIEYTKLKCNFSTNDEGYATCTYGSKGEFHTIECPLPKEYTWVAMPKTCREYKVTH